MSLLTSKPTKTVLIGEKTYTIETDFRKWIKFSQLAFSREQDIVSFAKIIDLVFKKESGCPPASVETVQAILEFYNPFKVDAIKSGNSVRGKQNYDFEYDSKYIYSSFLQQYNIDLTRVDLHWWVFKALLDGLSENTPFGKILQFRCADVSKIKDKEMRKHYEKMQRIYALPDNRAEEEKERDFADNLSAIF